MSKIDMSQLVTAEEKAAKAQAARTQAIKRDCTNRITEVLDTNTTLNIQGAAIAGALAPDELKVFEAGRMWVAAMQERCRVLIADSSASWGSDSDWPELPEGVLDLAELY